MFKAGRTRVKYGNFAINFVSIDCKVSKWALIKKTYLSFLFTVAFVNINFILRNFLCHFIF